MSNSSLITYKRISPNRNSPRNHAIDTITIHCIVGQWTAKQGCDYFANSSVGASPNYIVGKDGSIGLSVEEKDRSWCTSSGSNDNRAVTIEVASDTKHPYAVTDAALKALIKLVADICKRNNIKKLLWKGDKKLIGQVSKQNMTVHRWFANKSCPGDYLYNKHTYIANEVNKLLGASSGATTTTNTNTTSNPASTSKQETSTDYVLSDGAKLKLTNAALYVSATAKTSAGTRSGTYYVWSDEAIGGRIRITNSKLNVGKAGKVTGWINASVAKNALASKIKTFVPYKVRVSISDLYIRKGAGTNYAKNGFIKKGVYTIIAEESGTGSTKGWGKLKSGAGWVSLDYVTRT